jgi:hypothetical protein
MTWNPLAADLALHLRLGDSEFRKVFIGMYVRSFGHPKRQAFLEDFARQHGHADLLTPSTVTSQEDKIASYNHRPD